MNVFVKESFYEIDKTLNTSTDCRKKNVQQVIQIHDSTFSSRNPSRSNHRKFGNAGSRLIRNKTTEYNFENTWKLGATFIGSKFHIFRKSKSITSNKEFNKSKSYPYSAKKYICEKTWENPQFYVDQYIQLWKMNGCRHFRFLEY